MRAALLLLLLVTLISIKTGAGGKNKKADCKYRFPSWGECDPNSSLRTRTGTLKRALYNADCQQTISVFKPCHGKNKTKPKGRKNKGKRN
ncbi:Pleiotrophin [Larimichthys crocea]|uniref:Uncharacterized protein n=1 Tax=Larimichthys crocea TaxID=215358 RepID=A0ACD3QXL7_LARCR|nr:Pleiotrophin [Larimichthys crocea]